MAHCMKAQSRLGMIGLWPEETLDLRTIDRTLTIHVEPLGGSDAEPFHVAAKVSFSWDALSTARTATREEDTPMTRFGPDSVPKRKTVRPYHRIDFELRGSLMTGQELPMPSSRAWASWAEETIGRLIHIEPLTPQEKVRENKAWNLEVLAWPGHPEAAVLVGPDGELRLSAVTIAGVQLIETPRAFDIGKREDPAPRRDLQEMFHRVRASLPAWMQALDHLKTK